MNTKEYIDSGILELYALNALTPEEMKDVELKLREWPELQRELHAIQEGLNAFSLAHAKDPDARLKAKVLDNLPFQDEFTLEEKQESKIIEIRPKYPIWLVAASVALVLSTGVLFYRNIQFSNRISELEEQVSRSNQQVAELNKRLATNTNYLADISSPDTRKILLSSKTKVPGENAVVFLKDSDKQVFISTTQLPLLAADKQYQLWALVDGKPIDMGVLETGQFQLAKSIPQLLQAQAFAITIEKKGGSPSPTLEKLVALGSVS